ncbi:hypothetical protein ACJX0J_017350 [Zea mays]
MECVIGSIIELLKEIIGGVGPYTDIIVDKPRKNTSHLLLLLHLVVVCLISVILMIINIISHIYFLLHQTLYKCHIHATYNCVLRDNLFIKKTLYGKCVVVTVECLMLGQIFTFIQIVTMLYGVVVAQPMESKRSV